MSTPLSPGRWKILEPLIDAAIDLPTERRPAFLEEACGADAGLRAELEQLLLQYDQPDTLLNCPAARRFASLLGHVAAPPPELVGGNYRIERKLGQGGMAAVYLAHDIRHDRKVAVKVLHAELTAAFRTERFLAEIRTMARLRHPHLLPLHDSGEADGVLYYVMPYVEGETLRQRIDRERWLRIDEAMRITREIASALDSAHRRGVVHRDIKPENILLDEGGALVADFGIALAVSTASSPRGSLPGWIAGTPRYMSPEQRSGDGKIDRRSDVFSLGAVAYEMLAGRSPFMTGDADGPPPLVCLRDGLTAEADKVLTRALARLPEERYPTAGALADALQRSLAGVAPASDVRRTGKYGTSVAAIVVLVIAGVLAATGGPRTTSTPLLPVGPLAPPNNLRHLTNNLGAYDLYLRGLERGLVRSNSGQEEALQYFKAAIAADSTFAAAHAELAHVYTLASLFNSLPDVSRQEARVRARAAALKAVALDSTLAEAHAELGFLDMHAMYDLRSATAELQRAVVLDPASSRAHNYLANLYQWTERPGESLTEARRAIDLDPLSVEAALGLAGALYNNRQYEEALAQLDKLRDVDPPLWRAGLYAGNIYLSMGRWSEGVRTLQEWDEGSAWTGRALALSGRRAEARRYLADALAHSGQGDGDAYSVALVYEGLGDYDQAFAWLEKSLDDHSMWMNIMWPTFARLRADPRFDRIRHRLQGR